MSSRNWFIAIMAFISLSVILVVVDVVFAGVFALVVLILDPSSSYTVFRGVFSALWIIEIPFLVTYLYSSIKKRKD